MNGWNNPGRVNIATEKIANFMDRIKNIYITSNCDVKVEVARSRERLKLEDTIDLERVPIREGEEWGSDWSSAYMKLTIDIDEAHVGVPLAMRMEFGGEVLFYNEKAEPLYAFSNFSVFHPDFFKEFRPLGTFDRPQKLVLYAECAANELFGINQPMDIPDRRERSDKYGRHVGVLKHAIVGTYDQDAWELWNDFDFLWDYWQKSDKKSLRPIRVLGAMFDATLVYPEKGAKGAREVLRRVFDVKAGDTELECNVTGHAHIDTGWLWPIAETHRKVARTFANQIDNIERYPDYVFGASSALHYKWTKDEHPALYEKIRKAVKSGNWEIQGGMWIESDVINTGGESLVRQILKGKKFFMDEFGVDVETCHIPDSFGFPASLPQLMRKSGMKYFTTHKMSLNKHTVFPYDSFIWEGNDGSRVQVHFLPDHGYNSTALPGYTKRAAENFKEKDRLDEFEVLAGIGDGGGGPTDEHIGRVHRGADFAGVPKMKFGKMVDFHHRLEKHQDELEVFRGELYLELSRGTYTTQSENKRRNRKLEETLASAEFLLAALPEEKYPREKLDDALFNTLIIQFHDILPGSAIRDCYVEAEAHHARAYEDLREVIAEAVKTVLPSAAAVQTELGNVKLADGAVKAVAVQNASAWKGSALVDLDRSVSDMALFDSMGKKHRAWTYTACDGKEKTVAALPVEPWKWTEYDAASIEGCICSPKKKEPLVLENDLMKYLFSEDGRLISAVDRKSGRDFIPEGKEGNVLRLYHDDPHRKLEAWDVDYFYFDQPHDILGAESNEVVFEYCDAKMIRFTYVFGSSRIVQDITLLAGERGLTFDTYVDWHETRKLLKTEFPVSPYALESVSDISCGRMNRRTYVNNEQDFAQFEYPMRRFTDVSDGEHGIMLTTDSKYGASCRKDVLGISLLKSPLYPDPDCDMGEHLFSYGCYPHEGKLNGTGADEWSQLFNRAPVTVALSEKEELPAAECSIEGEGVEIMSIKMAEDGKGRVIRLVEKNGVHGKCRIVLPEGKTFAECDLLENIAEGAEKLINGEEVRFKPFEIRTFREI